MRRKHLIFVIMFFLFTSRVFASEFRVVFTEGANNFDSNLKYDNLKNKYLAEIKVYVDGKLIAEGFRGSTIPDSIFYYQMWHETNQNSTPTDQDIVNIFKTWKQNSEDISNNSNLNNFLQSMHDIISYIVSIPVIWSGKYNFTIGQHKDGNSVHGQPYVLRLQGTGDKDQPFNSKGNINEDDLFKIKGIWISTINQNSAEGMERIASGINIHRGRRSCDYKDSDGCLTIHPDDWGCFISIFPCIKEWNAGKHKGLVEIIRKDVSNSSINAPKSFKILDIPNDANHPIQGSCSAD